MLYFQTRAKRLELKQERHWHSNYSLCVAYHHTWAQQCSLMYLPKQICRSTLSFYVCNFAHFS